jgi:putative hemolysin
LIALVSSAFFSGAETAMISARRMKLEVWLRRKKRGAKQAYRFLQRPERLLTTTLVGTNIAVVAASFIMAIYLEPYFNGFVIAAISSVFLLLFGEILPKSLARERATGFTVFASPFLRFFYILFFPLIWGVIGISHLFLRNLGMKGESVRRFFTRKDLELLIREGEKIEIINKKERSLISRLILRGNQKIQDIMIPRTEIVTIKKDTSIPEAAKLFEKTGYSRLPVIGEDIDDILGIVTVKDILLKNPKTIGEVLRQPLFVPEISRMGSLLKKLKEEHMGIAIAVDEYGGIAGLVSLEDIVEEFFGDIHDEYDEEASLYRKISSHQMDVNAKIKIEEINQRFKIHLPEGNYQTLSGYLLEELGHIPRRGERLETDFCILTVLSSTRKRVNWVRIVRKNKALNKT